MGTTLNKLANNKCYCLKKDKDISLKKCTLFNCNRWKKCMQKTKRADVCLVPGNFTVCRWKKPQKRPQASRLLTASKIYHAGVELGLLRQSGWQTQQTAPTQTGTSMQHNADWHHGRKPVPQRKPSPRTCFGVCLPTPAPASA